MTMSSFLVGILNWHVWLTRGVKYHVKCVVSLSSGQGEYDTIPWPMGGSRSHWEQLYIIALQQSPPMMWTIPWNIISRLTSHYVSSIVYIFTLARTSFVLLHICMLVDVRENAYNIVCRARWVFSALVSESSPRLSGSGWIQTLVPRKNPSRTPSNAICL